MKLILAIVLVIGTGIGVGVFFSKDDLSMVVASNEHETALIALCESTPNLRQYGESRTAYICECAASRTLKDFPNMSIFENDWKNRFGHHLEMCILGD